jgi:hypothetical protein
MATRYAKFVIQPYFSASSDYMPNLAQLTDYDDVVTTATKHLGPTETSAATSATTVIAANTLTTGLGLYVKNLDETNYVDVSVTTAGGACVIRLTAGRSFYLPSFTASTAVTATANTSACFIEWLAIGT